MSRLATETSIEEIASVLARQRDQGQCAVLFLGARAGGLFGNEHLYGTLKNFSPLNFYNLSNKDRFKECYRCLSKHFSENEIHNILVDALGPLKYREEDKFLTGLIKEGFIDVVISTNIDTLLEDACSFWNMQEPNDYRVFIPGKHDITELVHSEPKYGFIIKVFGDLVSLRYNSAGGEFDLKADSRLKEFLESILSRNVLVAGYDPVWDQPIERAFPEEGGALWYVNEDSPPQDGTYFAHMLGQRCGKYLEGIQRSYGGFWRVLSDFIEKGAIREREAMLFHSPPRSQSSTRKRVFISYSHKDQQYLDELLPHLKSYEQRGMIDCWSDKKIEVGTDWQEKISQALEAAEVAVLLISKYFLSSKFITDFELPRLLSAAQNKDLVIVPVILGKCLIQNTPLHRFQAINSLDNPLNLMRSSRREFIWVEVAKRIIET